MTDSFERTIDYLRLSVTARCNMNCDYCRRAEGGEEMTLGEIRRIVRLFSMCGIKKIRLTGGEPLIRDDVCDIIGICKAAADEVALTTNGILLPEMAASLKAAGLDRVNISIDSLTGGVPAGVDAAIEAGLTPVKINTVLMKGVNDGEIANFIKLTKEKDVHVRFIEYMPMGEKDLYVSAQGIKRGEKISCITSVSKPFCEHCNRVRVTPDCKIRLCLGNNLEIDLRELMKSDDETATQQIEAFVKQKPQRGFCGDFLSNRGMGNIGG